MSIIAEKPKSWTRQISELETGTFIDFPAEKERSISAIISGKNRGGLRENYPNRKFSTEKVVITNLEKGETEALRVKRIA